MVFFQVILNGVKHETFQVHGFHGETNTGPFVFSLCSSLVPQKFPFDRIFLQKMEF